MKVEDLLVWLSLHPSLELLGKPTVVKLRRRKKEVILKLLQFSGNDQKFNLDDVPEEPWVLSNKPLPENMINNFEFKDVVVLQEPEDENLNYITKKT